MTWDELRAWYKSAGDTWTAEQVKAAGEIIARAKSLGHGPPTCGPAEIDAKILDMRWAGDGYVSAEISPDGSVKWWTWVASRGTFSARGLWE